MEASKDPLPKIVEHGKMVIADNTFKHLKLKPKEQTSCILF